MIASNSAIPVVGGIIHARAGGSGVGEAGGVEDLLTVGEAAAVEPALTAVEVRDPIAVVGVPAVCVAVAPHAEASTIAITTSTARNRIV